VKPDLPDTALRVSGVVVVLLVDHLPQHRAWAWLRLMRGPTALRDVPGLRFAKVMGSGEDGGFGLRPSGTHQGLICLFGRAEQAQAFLEGPVVAAYQARARQCWSSMLAVTDARGRWDGCAWGLTDPSTLSAPPAPAGGPVAAITRASIRPTRVASFWRRAPATQEQLRAADGCTLAIGLGEAPLLRQCTFSVWRDTDAMQAYARSGAHGRAATAAYRDDFFSEMLFARMAVLSTAGAWTSAPLATLGQATPEDAHG
jgi:hypothetical protein